MKRVLIIPHPEYMQECLQLAEEYHLGFEYNDFFMPETLDDTDKLENIIRDYSNLHLPEYTTLHGAFFDVIPFSVDAKIKEIADLRIEQSIQVAKRLGAKAVVFHTNYNPFLNSEDYVKTWIQINIAYWKDVLKKHPDINIYLENMFDRTPDLIEALAQELSCYENFGICLDYAHAALSDVKPELWAERLGKYVKHVHINDNDLVSDLHLAWGDGKIDRVVFYECYEKYMNTATVLIETSSVENKIRSIEVLKKEGFI